MSTVSDDQVGTSPAATGPAAPGGDPAGPAGSGGDAVFAAFTAAGLWPGLSAGLAARLAEAGITAPEQVTTAKLEMVQGIGPKRARRLAASFEGALACYRVAEVLVPCRVPARFAAQAVARLGGSAAALLREDPWRLLTVPQLRPDQADWFARQLLGDQAHPQDPRRGRALVAYLLGQAARDGHTAVPAHVIASSLARFRVAGPQAAIEAALAEGTVLFFEAPAAEDEQAEGQPAGENGNPGDGEGPGGEAVAATPAGLLSLARYAMAEDAVGEGLQRLTALAGPLPEEDQAAPAAAGAGAVPGGAGDRSGETGAGAAATGGGLDEAQQGAVRAITEHGVCVLSGGPGTGKSRTVAAVVSLAARRGLRVALAAPTGRAAKRLEELAGAPATTLHRLLGAQGRSRVGPGAGDGREQDASPAPGEATWVFTRNEEWPLDADLVVVDEVSMLDAELAAALVEACADGTRLLLVGDPAQLPSIGAGRVLADIIDSGTVPVTQLTRLYRQQEGGIIARLATAVRGGALPPVDAPDREVVVVPVRGSADAAHRVVQLVTDSIPRALGIAPADIQVITPVHKGPAGTIELNRLLKQRLNPGPGTRAGFDPGDRVVSIANHADEGFTNGEVGTVVGPADDGLDVAFPAGPVRVPDKLLADLRHGWALTVHRAQGSEWPAVVAVFPGEATSMLSRPLVYTALTRAQRHLSVVHGTGPALARAVATVGERPRVTRLAGLLRGELPG